MPVLPLAIHERNYAGSGEPDIRPTSLPVTRDSDVIRKVEEMTNAGCSAAAGVVTGAWNGTHGVLQVIQVFQTP